ncbi:MAG: hypothetical protein R3253_02270 [Longimicrobiales bacterium]|nr:hypothetical protein [Longimicrobiales bacterium]
MRTMRYIRSAAAVAALLALPGAVMAQDVEGFDEEPVDNNAMTLDFEARAGMAVPAADYMEFTDAGIALGLGAAMWLHDNVAIRADGNLSALEGETDGLVSEAPTPDANLYHYGVGVEIDVPGRASPGPWDFEINAGVGGTLYDTEAFIPTAQGPADDITKTYPQVNGGMTVGHQITEDIVLSVSGQAYYTFLDEADLQPISDLRVRETLENGVAVPVTLQLRWDLPPVS